jgi:thiamine-monophosphate kinase
VDEFDLIRRFFSRDAEAAGTVVGVGDDGAVLQPTPGTQQIQVTDTLVEGVHFPANIGAADIGYRCVAVNLSDIAAMGGRPRWMCRHPAQRREGGRYGLRDRHCR